MSCSRDILKKHYPIGTIVNYPVSYPNELRQDQSHPVGHKHVYVSPYMPYTHPPIPTARRLYNWVRNKIFVQPYNFSYITSREEKKFVPTSLSAVIEQDPLSVKASSEVEKKAAESLETDNVTTTTTTTTTIIMEKKTVVTTSRPGKGKATEGPADLSQDSTANLPKQDYLTDGASSTMEMMAATTSTPGAAPLKSVTYENEDEIPLFLGLRVYTKKDAVAVVTGSILDIPR